ncbi:MAG TPA: glycogen debranching enzyme GlgX, partial [Rudaea sp.]|nr:glycogen debranching enzyme GlgX [Rudaea sp.]
LAQGTPMLLAGDEFGQSQGGNNNAYCQDNELAWLDWSRLEREPNRILFAFLQRLVALRRKHAVLRSGRFLEGNRELAPGVGEIGWFDVGGQGMSDAAWRDADAQPLALRRAAHDGHDVAMLLLLLNGGGGDVEFALPPPACAWTLLLDSADPAAQEHAIEGDRVHVSAHALLLLGARLAAGAAA